VRVALEGDGVARPAELELEVITELLRLIESLKAEHAHELHQGELRGRPPDGRAEGTVDRSKGSLSHHIKVSVHKAGGEVVSGLELAEEGDKV
jgi:hypothetical protein